MIQNRWRQSNGSNHHKHVRTNGSESVDEYNQSGEDSSNHDEETIKPTLLFRRTNPNYDHMQGHGSVHFLNSSTILGADSRGHFDIIGISQSTWDEGFNNEGCGKLLAETKLSTPCMSNTIIHDLAVHGYENGSKFAVGLLSGDMEIVSSERTSSEQSDTSILPPIHALWSSLPPVATQYIGPRRRFLRNETYSLQRMLSLTDHETLMEASHDPSIFTEISCWKDDSLRTNRAEHSDRTRRPKNQWAFHEGGLGSSSALIGACVDAEMDCFSLRVVDERNSKPSVYVDAGPESRPNEEHMECMCFTNEFGLVAGYSKREWHPDNIIKLFDLRMIGKHPVKSMNLSFPYNDIVETPPLQEMTVERRMPVSKEDGPTGYGRLLPFDRTKSRDLLADCNDPHDAVPFHMKQLTGASNSSNRFAASLLLDQPCPRGGVRYQLNAIIDSTRCEIVQQIGDVANQYVSSTCFSSCLNSMACWRDAQAEERSFLSIYDISTNSSVSSTGSKKRQFADILNTSDGCLATIEPKLLDLYGIPSSARRIAMDDYGSAIAAITYDGDYYIISP